MGTSYGMRKSPFLYVIFLASSFGEIRKRYEGRLAIAAGHSYVFLIRQNQSAKVGKWKKLLQASLPLHRTLPSLMCGDDCITEAISSQLKHLTSKLTQE